VFRESEINGKCISLAQERKVIKYRQVISNSVKTCQTGFQITAATYAAINHFRVQGDKMVLSHQYNVSNNDA